MCFLHSFILSQALDSDLAWRQPILYRLQKDRGSFFLAVVDPWMCMVRHAQSVPRWNKYRRWGWSSSKHFLCTPLKLFCPRCFSFNFHPILRYLWDCGCSPACYWLIVYIDFIHSRYVCMLSGCIPCHAGRCDKVLRRLQAAASMDFRGEEVRLDRSSCFKWFLLKQT